MTEYLENQLNVYDTYTYNISMFMIRPDSVPEMERNISLSGRSVLIIDNAREARYNISDLEQHYVSGHNKVRSAFGHRFNITVSEPNGVTLLDTIRKAANRLGIVNHQQAIYLLRIEFNGRTANGAVRKHPQVFYYPVVIREFEFKVDEGGTMYYITAHENSTTAYNYLNNVIRNQITIEAATVGEFFDLFNQRINQSAEEAITYSTDQLYADTINYEFDESISSWEQWQFQALAEKETHSGFNIISSGAGDSKLQITINNGSNLTDIVTVILGLTAEYKNILLEGNGSREYARERPNEDPRHKLDQLPVFHKVQANLEYGEYDILRGEYAKKITYRIKPYIIADEIISPQVYINGINNSQIQRQRVENLRQSELLRKKYEYIYTGKNTEVLEFDIKFDRAYYYVTPYGGGQFGYADNLSPVQSQSTDNPLSRLEEEAGRLLGVIGEERAEISRLERQRAGLKFDLPQAGGVLDAALGAIDVQITTSRSNFRNAASQYNQILNEIGYSPDTLALQMRFATDVVNDDDGGNSSDNDNRGGMLRFGALQANIDNPADLAKIELMIRGDPYWLGRPNSFYNTGLAEDPGLANYERGTHGFFLKLNLPQPFEDSQGRRKPSPEYEVSGYYTVRDVIARYRDGQFTMILNSVRDAGTNTPTAADALDREDASAPSLSNSRTRQAGIDLAQLQENISRGLI